MTETSRYRPRRWRPTAPQNVVIWQTRCVAPSWPRPLHRTSRSLREYSESQTDPSPSSSSIWSLHTHTHTHTHTHIIASRNTSLTFHMKGWCQQNVPVINVSDACLLGYVSCACAVQTSSAVTGSDTLSTSFEETTWPMTQDQYVVWPVLANVNCCRPSVCRLSVVCNGRAPYSGGCNFRQSFYDIWYLGHPLTSMKNFTEMVPGEPLHRGN